jgi:hypothetical protein
MTVTHIVLFKFKSSADQRDVKAVSIQKLQDPSPLSPAGLGPLLVTDSTPLQACARFLGLKDSCLHPTSNGNYILSLRGGNDNSPEGLQVRKRENELHAAQTHADHLSQDGITYRFCRRVRLRREQGLICHKGPIAPGVRQEHRGARREGSGRRLQQWGVLWSWLRLSSFKMTTSRHINDNYLGVWSSISTRTVDNPM